MANQQRARGSNLVTGDPAPPGMGDAGGRRMAVTPHTAVLRLVASMAWRMSWVAASGWDRNETWGRHLHDRGVGAFGHEPLQLSCLGLLADRVLGAYVRPARGASAPTAGTAPTGQADH